MKYKYSHGFTLVELMIAVSIIALILGVIFINWRVQINRGQDVLRKKHLTDIKRAFEEYFNDKGCYPSATVLSTCNGTALQPYLAAIPCDPVSKLPYKYVPVNDANLCSGYRVFTSLRDTSDADIGKQGCNGVTGCGFGVGFNYGISSGATVALPGFNPNYTPTPTPPFQTGFNACDANGICNSTTNLSTCPVSYADSNCYNQCSPTRWDNRCL
ncbi:MAG: type II secretion system protein [Candidatus Gottesmanbacteria bacterium]|nr:type II secretion system protein [Candidatus Gottesmanbacteria bacterium]